MALFVTQRRVVSLLLAVQALLGVPLLVYMVVAALPLLYQLAVLSGVIGYAGLWWAYRRGIDQARYVAVLFSTALIVSLLGEPHLTQQPSLSVLLPPVLALAMASPSWVIGVTVLEIAVLSLRAGWDSVLLQPIQLSLMTMVVAGLLVSRRVIESALFEAEQARRQAERRMSQLLEQRERAERLESELLHAQRLESLGRLAGGVAHDFNNLLTVISGSAMLAQRSLPAEHAAIVDLDEIQNASKRAANLTRQLLAFARRQVLVKRTLDLRELLLGLERMLVRLIGERIVLETEVPEHELLVNVDPAQLEQVILNLVLNARDAMPDGGRVSIVARRSALPGGRQDGGQEFVRIDVSDSGAGMSEEVQSHLFEPFFTTKELGRGTGLGLATALGVVQQHGGHLLLDSSSESGSTFSVYLPLVKGTVDERSSFVTRTLPRGRERVLLVEDDPRVLRITAKVLEEAGYAVETAENAQAAFAALEREPFDVLVSDVVMPGLSGLELVESARQRYPKLAAVLMSGYADALTRPSGERNLPEYLQKPFSPRALVEAVQRALVRLEPAPSLADKSGE